MRKIIYTLNIGNYEENIVKICRPYLRAWAHKIGAEIVEITERKFPDWPVTYEKLQIHELGRGNDWSIYVDSDALIHPDLGDVTSLINKDTVLFYGKDFAQQRWRNDNYFRRDGRQISACSWFVVCSDWTLDLWRPSDDLTPQEAINNIFPVQAEVNFADYMGQTGREYATHLVDDYTLSRNIARFGLKHVTIHELMEQWKVNFNPYFAHQFLDDPAVKLEYLADVVSQWSQVNGSVLVREQR